MRGDRLRLEVLTVTSIKDIHHPDMEATSKSETSVNFYQITHRNNARNGHIHRRCRVNLKANSLVSLLVY
jgi:hypothetical protein